MDVATSRSPDLIAVGGQVYGNQPGYTAYDHSSALFALLDLSKFSCNWYWNQVIYAPNVYSITT